MAELYNLSINFCPNSLSIIVCLNNKINELFTTFNSDKDLFEIFDKQKSEGIQYYKFNSKFYTENQMDSIHQVINDLITKQMIRELDSTGTLQ